MIADEGGARHAGVVLKLLHLFVGVSELLLDRLLAGKKAELGAIEARAHQIVDRVLERVAIVEHPNGLADHVGLFGSVHPRSPLGCVTLLAWPRNAPRHPGRVTPARPHHAEGMRGLPA